MSAPNAFSDTENQPVSNLPATVHFSSTLSQPAVAKEHAPAAEGVVTSEAPQVKTNQTPTGSSVHSSCTAKNPIGIQGDPADSTSGSNLQSTWVEDYSPTNKDSVIPELVKNQVNSGRPTASTHSSLLQLAQNNEAANVATQGAGSIHSNHTDQAQGKAADIQVDDIEKHSQAKVELSRSQTLNQSYQAKKEPEKLLGIPKYQSTYSGESEYVQRK
ncbi:hypothetical protein GYMLUDRAFT_63163 [Collybiopsis luxurians FD-317 M1]|uniref:Uncharacterized protein n=1 Tax=Collybiopsis luxurians FD-317 M1 TaxID=944289 RepID=A0A0D0CHD8_9AGAR|nr:hypothetical protein GYMLUDRAFT_63163 [Collybiopsis luxurians FD-317 M1]